MLGVLKGRGREVSMVTDFPGSQLPGSSENQRSSSNVLWGRPLRPSRDPGQQRREPPPPMSKIGVLISLAGEGV